LKIQTTLAGSTSSTSVSTFRLPISQSYQLTVHLVFELVSAYGTVGLSLGMPDVSKMLTAIEAIPDAS